jgi:hypothetical protein
MRPHLSQSRRPESLRDGSLKLEAEEEGQYKSYKEVLSDTAIKVAVHLKVSITEKEAKMFAASVPSWPPFSSSLSFVCVKG